MGPMLPDQTNCNCHGEKLLTDCEDGLVQIDRNSLFHNFFVAVFVYVLETQCRQIPRDKYRKHSYKQRQTKRNNAKICHVVHLNKSQFNEVHPNVKNATSNQHDCTMDKGMLDYGLSNIQEFVLQFYDR